MKIIIIPDDRDVVTPLVAPYTTPYNPCWGCRKLYEPWWGIVSPCEGCPNRMFVPYYTNSPTCNMPSVTTTTTGIQCNA